MTDSLIQVPDKQECKVDFPVVSEWIEGPLTHKDKVTLGITGLIACQEFISTCGTRLSSSHPGGSWSGYGCSPFTGGTWRVWFNKS